ncbi:F-box protein At2g26160-like [Solanum tuberosum]|uniref:F-box domain containing protein n=1 Tax=Solanum tuberosum TaxID=4113 RepID=M1DP21_SOLTU|nr:PREDICTED: F-box protein At2g26160-like [Solanum tuberosum]
MAGWAELPNDLIAHITNRVKVIEDFIAFRAVCTTWRIAATKDNFDVFHPQVPLFMLGAKDDNFQEFYSLSKKKVSHIFLPEVRGTEYLSTEGWLCTVVNDTGEMNLLHPFSRKKIQLPSRKALFTFHDLDAFEKHHWLCIDRAVLSANPSLTSDYVLMVHHYVAGCCLSFWRPGDLDWTHIDVSHIHSRVAALIYHKGKFYSTDNDGEIWAHQVGADQPIVTTRLVAEINQLNEMNEHMFMFRLHLVELSGALLVVSRFDDDSNGTFHTFKYKVYEVDVIRGELKKEMKALGDSSIFLGLNWGICIDSSKFIGIKPNHIYFAGDVLEELTEDMGAYNLEDGKIESFYPGQSTSLIYPPTWIMPSLIM